MVLNDEKILERINNDGLLQGHDDKHVKNCAYTLRAGKAFLPETGDEEILSPTIVSRNAGLFRIAAFCNRIRKHAWQIGPSEVLVVRTTERVKMPNDLCATYAPLYRLSRQGVMLLNASLVEPGYDGPLSCFLVNFSSQTIAITPNGPIAKITFHGLEKSPHTLVPEHFEDASYDSGLSHSARTFHKSFLDVAGIADRAAEKATQSAKRAVVFGSIFIALLLAWAQIEPLISTWFKKAPGWPTNASDRFHDVQSKLEIESKLKDMEFAKASLALQADILKLRAELDDLKAKIRK